MASTPTAARPTTPNNAHWYAQDGTPAYETPKKDGSGMRAVTLADARKLMLLPSVTSVIDKILRKPDLENWKVEQAVLAVLTSPKQPTEAVDAFVKRILHTEEIQNQEAAAARLKGIAIHDAIEAKLSGKPVEEMWLPWVEPAAAEVAKCGRYVTAEKILVGNEYAGKTDLIQEGETYWRIWDFKSTKKLPDKAAWDEHVIQLAAYAAAFAPVLKKLGDDRPILTSNCYISTTDQGAFKVHHHDPAWIVAYEEGFLPLLQVWQYLNSYKPSPLPKSGDMVATAAGTQTQLPYANEVPCFGQRQGWCESLATWRMQAKNLMLHWCEACKARGKFNGPENVWTKLEARP